MTAKEFDILEYLMLNQGKVLSRDNFYKAFEKIERAKSVAMQHLINLRNIIMITNNNKSIGRTIFEILISTWEK